jgi:putative hydrolase of HD superfamily
MPDPETEGLTNFLYEMGLLKRYKRTGWMVAGVDNPESIAEHSFRTAIIGFLLAVMEGADPARTAALCLFHDTQETRIGDVPYVGKAYVVTAPNVEVTADQVAGFPAAAGRAVRDLVDEYEARQSLEARLAKDADKLECLLQAREYQAQGQDVAPWIETSAADLQSSSARQLAETMVEGRRGVVSAARRPPLSFDERSLRLPGGAQAVSGRDGWPCAGLRNGMPVMRWRSGGRSRRGPNRTRRSSRGCRRSRRPG